MKHFTRNFEIEIYNDVVIPAYLKEFRNCWKLNFRTAFQRT